MLASDIGGSKGGSNCEVTFLDLFGFLFLALSLRWIDGSFFGHFVDWI
jgi:hypothetical protein